MSNSSQEPTFTITLNDDQIVPSDDITITWDNNNIIPAFTTTDVITLNGVSLSSGSYSTTSTIDLSGIESFSSFTNLYKEEFDGRFPDWDRVQEMCKEYPGLEIAFRKFKEVYKIVKEDYDGKERERRGKY